VEADATALAGSHANAGSRAGSVLPHPTETGELVPSARPTFHKHQDKQAGRQKQPSKAARRNELKQAGQILNH
jgi:hypothetical protein